MHIFFFNTILMFGSNYYFNHNLHHVSMIYFETNNYFLNSLNKTLKKITKFVKVNYFSIMTTSMKNMWIRLLNTYSMEELLNFTDFDYLVGSLPNTIHPFSFIHSLSFVSCWALYFTSKPILFFTLKHI